MKDVNVITIAGRLVRAPEVKDTDNGIKMAKFTIANNDDYKDKDGKLIEKVSFINVETYGGLAGVVERYATKGKPVVIVGRLEIREMEKDGKRTWYTVVKAVTVQLLGGGDEVAGSMKDFAPKIDHTAQKLPKEKDGQNFDFPEELEKKLTGEDVEIPF